MEYNLIQNPSLGSNLARFLGLKQAHVVPTLNEGVQAVVLVGDTTNPAGVGSASAPTIMRVGAFIRVPTALNQDAYSCFSTYLGTLKGTMRVREWGVSFDQTARVRMGINTQQIGGAPAAGDSGFAFLDRVSFPFQPQNPLTLTSGVQASPGANVVSNPFEEFHLFGGASRALVDPGIQVPLYANDPTHYFTLVAQTTGNVAVSSFLSWLIADLVTQ